MSALLGAIVPYYTSAKGRVPTDALMDSLGARRLEVGEIAFNLEDNLIFTKRPDNSIAQMGGSTLGKLLDVDAGETNPPVPGQALIWTGSKWTPKNRSRLQDLENVGGALPFNAAVLAYDSSEGKWVPSEGGLPGGVRAMNLQLGEVLTYDQTEVPAQWLLNFDVWTEENGADTPYEIIETAKNPNLDPNNLYPANLNPLGADEKFGDRCYRSWGYIGVYQEHGIRIGPDDVGPPLRTSPFTLEFWFKASEFQGGALIASNSNNNAQSAVADGGWFRVMAKRESEIDPPDIYDDNQSGRNPIAFGQVALTPLGQEILRSSDARTKTLVLRGSYYDRAMNATKDEQVGDAIDDGWDWFEGGDSALKYPWGPWNPENQFSREAELAASEARGDYPPNLDSYDFTWTTADDIQSQGYTPITYVGTRVSPHLDDSASGYLYLSNNGKAGQHSPGANYLCGTRTAELYDDEWHHIVFQHEGEGVYSCHVDGELMERRYRTQLNIEHYSFEDSSRYVENSDGTLTRVINEYFSKSLVVGPVDFWEWNEIRIGGGGFQASQIACQIDALRLIRYAVYAAKDTFATPRYAPKRIFQETKWINKRTFPTPFALTRNLVDTNVATTVFVASGDLSGRPSGARAFTAKDFIGNEYDLEFDFDVAADEGCRLVADWPAYPNGSFYFDGTATGIRPAEESGSIPEIGNQDFTISFWFRFEGGIDNEFQDNDRKKWLLKLGEAGPAIALEGRFNRIIWRRGISDGFYDRAIVGAWAADQDYHIALVRSGELDKFLVFLNGQLVDEYDGAAGNIQYQTPFTVPQLGESPGTSTPDNPFEDPPVGFTGWISEVVIKIGQALWTENFTPPPVWGDGSFNFPDTVFGALAVWEDYTFICTEAATFEIDGAVKTPSVWMPLGGGAGGGGGGLGDLLNVDLTSTLAKPGNLLGFDGNNWIPFDALTLNLQLEELGNVVPEGIDQDGVAFNRDGSALVWNETDQQWKPGFSALSRLKEPDLLPGVRVAEFHTNPLEGNIPARNTGGSDDTSIDSFIGNFQWLMEGPRLAKYSSWSEWEDDGWFLVTKSYAAGNVPFQMPYEEFWDIEVLDGYVGNTPNGPTGWTVGKRGFGWRTDGTHASNNDWMWGSGMDSALQSEQWDFWMAWFSHVSAELKGTGIKRVVRDDRLWLVVRTEWRIPYAGGAGFHTEFWLSLRGEVICMLSRQFTGGYNWHWNETKGLYTRGKRAFDRETLGYPYGPGNAPWWPYRLQGTSSQLEFLGWNGTGGKFATDKGMGWYFKPGRLDPDPPEIWLGNGIGELKDVNTDSVSEGDALLWDGDSHFVPTQVLTKVDTLSQVLDVDASALQGVPRESGYVLTWDNAIQNWMPKPIPLPKIGRGDAGDFDLGETQGIFLFGVYGGGDFATGDDDLPIELTEHADTDGGELTGGLADPPPEDRTML